jgi:hypothetical protein
MTRRGVRVCVYIRQTIRNRAQSRGVFHNAEGPPVKQAVG